MKSTPRGLIIDLLLNIAVPYAIYTIAHNHFGLNDVISLTLSSLYPIFDIIVEFSKDRTLNFISVIVLLGTVTGIAGALIGGDPKLILVRESFFTFLLSIACFITLATGKPLMFYFAREFVAGKDPEKRKEFSKILEKKNAFNFFRLLTLVWGIVYLLEFILKVIIVYSFPISESLLIGPVVTYVIIFGTIFWTFWYAKKRRPPDKSNT
jgi:hypothetical protein